MVVEQILIVSFIEEKGGAGSKLELAVDYCWGHVVTVIRLIHKQFHQHHEPRLAALRRRAEHGEAWRSVELLEDVGVQHPECDYHALLGRDRDMTLDQGEDEIEYVDRGRVHRCVRSRGAGARTFANIGKGDAGKVLCGREDCRQIVPGQTVLRQKFYECLVCGRGLVRK